MTKMCPELVPPLKIFISICQAELNGFCQKNSELTGVSLSVKRDKIHI